MDEDEEDEDEDEDERNMKTNKINYDVDEDNFWNLYFCNPVICISALPHFVFLV